MNKKEPFKFAAKGAFLFFTVMLIEKLITFSFFCILSRSINLDFFGIIAVLLALIEAVGISSNVGITSCLFLRDTEKKDFLDSMFTFSLISGGLFCFLFILLGNYICHFLSLKNSFPFLCILAPIFFFNKLGIVQSALLSKHQNYKTLALTSLVATFFSFLSALTVFCVSPPYSLAWFYLFQSLLQNIFLYCYAKEKLKVVFRLSPFISQTFGSWKLSATSIVNLLNDRALLLIINHFFGHASAGLYSLASRPSSILWQSFGGSLSKVILPTFSQIKNSNEQILAGIKTYYLPIFLFLLPLVVFMSFNSENILILIYGSGVSGGGYILSVSLFSTYFFASSYLFDPILITLNKFRSCFYFSLIRFLINCSLFISGFFLTLKTILFLSCLACLLVLLFYMVYISVRLLLPYSLLVNLFFQQTFKILGIASLITFFLNVILTHDGLMFLALRFFLFCVLWFIFLNTFMRNSLEEVRSFFLKS